PNRLAASRRRRHANGVAGAGVQHRPRLLRQLPPRTPPRQPAASPARLLRRPHLPADRQAAGAEVPQRVAGVEEDAEGIASSYMASQQPEQVASKTPAGAAVESGRNLLWLLACH